MLTLVTGGARSGKSHHAQGLCGEGRPVLFLATAGTAGDPEMRSRVLRHRAERPSHWKTVEEPLDVVSAVRDAEPGALVLLDCVTLWIANLLYEHRGLDVESRERRILSEVGALAEACLDADVVAVTNEVGEGLVPETPLGREFRDLQGQANQILARAASRVVLMVVGIPVVVKEPDSR